MVVAIAFAWKETVAVSSNSSSSSSPETVTQKSMEHSSDSSARKSSSHWHVVNPVSIVKIITEQTVLMKLAGVYALNFIALNAFTAWYPLLDYRSVMFT